MHRWGLFVMLPCEVLIQILLLEGSDGVLLSAHISNFLLSVAAHQFQIELILYQPLLWLGCTSREESAQGRLAVGNYCLIIEFPTVELTRGS